MKRKSIKSLVVATVLASAMLLGACGASNNDAKKSAENIESTENAGSTESPESTQETGSNDTVVVTDARGEVEIPANPQRIVDISGNSDILSILGYSVIGTANSDAYDYTKFPSYLEDVLGEAKIVGYSMQDTMDIEAILALEPDLIIMSSVQESMYEQLKTVTPTVMIELEQIDWTKDLMKVATVFDKTQEAEEWLASYQVSATAKGEEIKAKYGEDTSYLSFLASGGSIYIFDAAGMGSVLYNDLGLAKPEGMPEQENMSLPVVTYEGLAAIDADYIFAVGTEEDLAQLYESSIWKNMTPVKEGHVVELPASPYFNMGYSSIGKDKLFNEVESLLEKVDE